MKEFEFYQDIKVTVWERQRFTVEAESYEQALEIVKEYQDKDVSIDYPIGDSETLFETEEFLTPEENGGYSTIELYNDGREFIGGNGK